MFHEINMETGRPSDNDFATFLKGRYNTEIYRYDGKILAIYFSSNRTVNNLIPLFKELGVKLTKESEGDFESVYLFSEKDISKVAKILKFQTKGKNISPKSKKTAKRLLK